MTVFDAIREAERRAAGFRADEMMYLAQQKAEAAALARAKAAALEEFVRALDDLLRQEVACG